MDLTPVLDSVRDLGSYIREQRLAARLTVRGLADRAGISNPYLSQVERGLRKPSAAILSQIADGLSMSAESLLTLAGVIPARTPASAVEESIRADTLLADRHKAVLIDTYRAFLEQTAPRPSVSDTTAASVIEVTADPGPTRDPDRS